MVEGGDQRRRWELALIACEGWILKHVAGADPMRWSTAAEAAFRRKCFTELALNILLAEAMGWSAEDEPKSALASIRLYLRDKVDSCLIDLAQRSPDRASLLALPLAYAASAGWLSENETNRVKSILTSSTTWGFERLPFRYLDLAVACQLVNVSPCLSTDALLAVSSIHLPPNAAVAHRDAFYGITHAAFYAKLLGKADILQSQAIACSVHGGLLRCMSAMDIDLALELTVAACLSRMPVSSAMTSLLNTVADNILENEAVDAVRSDLSSAFSQSRKQEAAWADRIHTMEVAALAFRSALSSSNTTYISAISSCSTNIDILLGSALHAFYHNDIAAAAENLKNVPIAKCCSNNILVRESAINFLRSCERENGSFGYLVDEKHLFISNNPDLSFYSNIQKKIDISCFDLLY